MKTSNLKPVLLLWTLITFNGISGIPATPQKTMPVNTDALLMNYYNIHSPERLALLVNGLREKHFFSASQHKHLAIGFFSSLITMDQTLFETAFGKVSDLPSSETNTVAMIAWMSNTETGNQVLEEMGLDSWREKKAPDLTQKTPNTPEEISLHYGRFFATGDPLSIAPLIPCLEYIKYSGASARFQRQPTQALQQDALKEKVYYGVIGTLPQIVKRHEVLQHYIEGQLADPDISPELKLGLVNIVGQYNPDLAQKYGTFSYKNKAQPSTPNKPSAVLVIPSKEQAKENDQTSEAPEERSK